MPTERHAGLLLHPTSLPGPEGIGTLGDEARRFIDFMVDAGQTLWQILPLGPTGYGNSPYSCYSAFAGNPLLIDLSMLAEEGDIGQRDIPRLPPAGRVDFDTIRALKTPVLKKAAESFLAADTSERKREFWHFCDNTFWLHDYALFMAAKEHFTGKGWNQWPAPLAQRDSRALARYSAELGAAIGVQKYIQWQFARQWRTLKAYANARKISIIGDVPIFVAYDSADVWCNPHFFHLDARGRSTVVAGVPPDYFSRTGQRWGNPLYDWDRMAADGYGWWIARLRNDLQLYDMARIDHFRGFEAYWEIPARSTTAVRGRWVRGPGEGFFHAVRHALGGLPIIAEDLGVITREVEELRDRFDLPGMRILQFAFDGGSGNPYLPHNYTPNCVVYTGTHDNNTTLGWFHALSDAQQRRVCDYLGCSPEGLPGAMLRAALSSVARYAIIPVQDILALGPDARMNIPGVPSGNWGWRLTGDELTTTRALSLKGLAGLFNRIRVE